MRDWIYDYAPIVLMLGFLGALMGGLMWHYHDLAEKCIAVGMQWVGSSCVR